MRRLRGASAWAVAMAIALVAPAHAAPSIESAKALVDASDYLAARTQLAELIASGTLNRQELGDLYRLSGIVAGALGETEAATEAFKRCLALTPRATLPVGTSPKIGRPFAAAQAFFTSSAPLEIKAETAASPPAITILTVSDPLAMIARFRVFVTVDGEEVAPLERPAADDVTLRLPVGQRIDLRIAALDAQGNRLAEVGSTDVPIVIVGPRAPQPTGPPAIETPGTPRKPPPTARPRPVYLAWWLWGGAAVAFGGAGSYFGIRAMRGADELDALNAASLSHSFDEARAVEDRTRRDVLVTNVALGAAAVVGVTAIILYLTAPDAPTTERPVRAIAPVPVTGGGAIVLEGTF